MAFATVEQFEARTARVFVGAARVQLQALLDDATAHLQALTGQQIEAGTTTAVLHLEPCEQWLRLPQLPVRQVTAVKVGRAGFEVPTPAFELVDQQLHLAGGWWNGDANGYGLSYGPVAGDHGHARVLVSFAYGHTVVPGDLRSWAIVLASQALAHLAQGGAFGSAGLQSERIDDYAVNFATSGDGASAFHIPALAAEQLRARYGAGTYVTASR